MSYVEVQKLHDIKSLATNGPNRGRDEVLTLVLAIALDLESAAWCLGCGFDAPITRWPSTLYRVLAHTAVDSAEVWSRCARLLDRCLQDAALPYAERSAAELAAVFLDGRESLAGQELAAVLWCLIRRRCPSHDLVAERLSRELQVVAARRLSLN
jgi:hypothetical protein